MVLDTKSLIFHKEPEDITVQYFSSLQRILGQVDLGFHCIVPFVNTCDCPWQKLVNRSKWALTLLDWGFQNSSNLSHIVFKLSSYLGRLDDTYWSIPKYPVHAITFLHCCFSEEGSQLTFKYIFHISISTIRNPC